MSSFMHTFFDKDREFVLELLDTFDIEFDESAKTPALVDILNTQIAFMGLHSYLESVSLSVLQDVAIKENLTKKVVTSRDRLVEGLLTNKIPEKRVVSNGDDDMPTLKEIGSKKSIPKSDYWQMWQHYNLVDIVEYCKKNHIKSSGTKKEVIERILAWREADKENKKKFEVKEEVLARVAQRKKSLASEKKDTKKRSSSQKEKEKEKEKKKKKILESDDEEDDKEEEEEKEEVKEKVVKKTVEKVEPKEKVVKKAEKVEPKEKVVVVKKTEEVEEVEEVDEMEEDGVAEEDESKLISFDSVGEEEQFDIVAHPENFTLDTLIEVCKFHSLTVPDDVETRQDYIALINRTVLDLDNLDKYSLESLKDYVKETGLEVKGKGRQAIVDAILAAGDAS